MTALADIALPDRDRPSPPRRHHTAVRLHLEDATLTGLTYVGDARAEEEFGVGELRDALTGPDPRNFAVTDDGYDQHVRVFADRNAIMLSTRPLPEGQPRWGQKPSFWGQGWEGNADYETFYNQERDSNIYRERFALERKRVDELRAAAKAKGITPLPRRKSDLVDRLLDDVRAAQGEKLDWPGWFHYGELFVLRADTGPTAQVLAGLIDAINARTLTIGDGSAVFAIGMFLYDARDETSQLQQARTELLDWHDEQEAAIAPVRDELKGNYQVIFLGRPTLHPERHGDEQTRWWLNIAPARRWGGQEPEEVRGHTLTVQHFGYYTREELLNRDFLEDAVEQQKKREREKAERAASQQAS